MPQQITSLTLKIVEGHLRLDSYTYSNGHALVSAITEQGGSNESTESPGTAIFLLGDSQKQVHIYADKPPWPLSELCPSRDFTSKHIREYILEDSYPRLSRLKAWAMVQLAGRVDIEEVLFRRGLGNCFSLIPDPIPEQMSRSPVPLQWSHHSPVAISSYLANRPCAEMDEDTLLSTLNHLFGTQHPMGQHFRNSLKHLLHTLPDFGTVYGVIRPSWKSDVRVAWLPDIMAQQKANDEAMRFDAVKGDYLKDAAIPPRRVWDLYSNRVIPFYLLPTADSGRLPRCVWTVSHSWVHAKTRSSVITPINGREWPVPIPRNTTLDHVRIELLNLGAEYVWLDVLCLRQIGNAADEPRRKDEWKLDIPTIGYIYSIPGVPCVTYFNGLGLPFDPSEEACQSPLHWFHRIWTMQESTGSWLPGGMTTLHSDRATAFFDQHYQEAIVPRSLKWSHFLTDGQSQAQIDREMLESIVEQLIKRHSTTELDKISSLAYILACSTHPLYDSSISVELAWDVLLKHLSQFHRSVISLRHMERRRGGQFILPTWREFLTDFSPSYRYLDQDYNDKHRQSLYLSSKSRLGDALPGKYWQNLNCAGPYTVINQTQHRSDTTTLSIAHQTITRSGEAHRQVWFVRVTGGPVEDHVQYLFWRTPWRTTIILRVLRWLGSIGGDPAYEVRRCGATLDGAHPYRMEEMRVYVEYAQVKESGDCSVQIRS